jgi:hypothetical protein
MIQDDFNHILREQWGIKALWIYRLRKAGEDLLGLSREIVPSKEKKDEPLDDSPLRFSVSMRPYCEEESTLKKYYEVKRDSGSRQ